MVILGVGVGNGFIVEYKTDVDLLILERERISNIPFKRNLQANPPHLDVVVDEWISQRLKIPSYLKTTSGSGGGVNFLSSSLLFI